MVREGLAVFPVTAAEQAGLLAMRHLLKSLRVRGDERARVVWVWNGEQLVMLEIDRYKVLVEAG